MSAECHQCGIDLDVNLDCPVCEIEKSLNIALNRINKLKSAIIESRDNSFNNMEACDEPHFSYYNYNVGLMNKALEEDNKLKESK